MASTPARASETDPLYVVLLGYTGAGKSATGNSILRKQVFESKLYPTRVSSQCHSGMATFEDRLIKVLDTPSFLFADKRDDSITEENLLENMRNFPGINAFIYVIKIGRFTKKDLLTLAHLQKSLGEDFLKHTVVVFTGLDDLENDGDTLDTYVQCAPDNLKVLLKKCSQNYMAINNRASVADKNTDIKLLIEKVLDITRHNGGLRYTLRNKERKDSTWKRINKFTAASAFIALSFIIPYCLFRSDLTRIFEYLCPTFYETTYYFYEPFQFDPPF